MSGDIETNPGPVTNYSQGFKICHWNLNSLPTDNFIKIPHLEAYAISHNIDIFCLSETFLNSSYSNNDTRLHLHGYSLIRADHPSDLKRGGVCIYYKEHLPLICKPNLTPLDECLVCELKIGNKKCFISVLYRSPSQSLEEFERFKNGWVNTKINLKIYYLPLYERLVWDYSKAELTNIRKSLSQINWHNALKNLNVNDQVEYLSSCILNVFSNFVPNKTITCRDKDPLRK